ncbi:MAG: UDP-N-acetylmuramoyl-L-alanine--D-glutamate ligase [Nitrospirales bacterium]|nr:UDP-N-acetylmuramoyl-L-alanine--D-glutamate ligase [Nitrospirales bacterium]
MIMDFRGKRVAVVGIARSGVGAANLLSAMGADVTVTDRKSPQDLQGFLEGLLPEVKQEIGHHPEHLFTDADLIVISPGVPLSIAPLRLAAEKGVPIIGELELAFLAVSHQPSAISTQMPEFLAVTGTNGKSTTTMLLYEMMKAGGFDTLLGGNIGYALTEEIYKRGQGPGSRVQKEEDNGREELESVSLPSLDPGPLTLDPVAVFPDPGPLTQDPCFIVAEVSSFQLETIDSFRPRVAAILNVTPDHLDRYTSMEEYLEAKCRVFLNQQAGDFLVLNADDPMTEEILERVQGQGSRVQEETGREAGGASHESGGAGPKIYFFSREKEVKGVWCRDGVIRFDLPGLASDFRFHTSYFRIKGVHNIENAMAAALMALLSGCSPEAVAATLRTFPGLEHRLELVRELDGVQYINDSKGTNVGAVIKSLEGFTSPVILIAGGKDKHGDFEELRPFVQGKVKALVLIGEARELIGKALGDLAPVSMETDFLSAVRRAKALASPGDVVLLSPACASFDMFRDFEDRGRQFKEIVQGL